MPALIPLTVPEIQRLLLALDEPPDRFSFRLAWSHFRRRHQAVAKRGHAVRRVRRQVAAPSAARPVVRPVRDREGEPSPLTADLTDGQWHQLAPLLPAQRRRQGQPPRDLRQMINAMLWIERTGCSWRALPSHFGPWQDVYARYHRWRQDGRWLRIRQTLQPHVDEAACA